MFHHPCHLPFLSAKIVSREHLRHGLLPNRRIRIEKLTPPSTVNLLDPIASDHGHLLVPQGEPNVPRLSDLLANADTFRRAFDDGRAESVLAPHCRVGPFAIRDVR